MLTIIANSPPTQADGSVINTSIIPFPPRGPFAVYVEPDNEGGGWLVLCRGHGWRHGGQNEAIVDADEIATGFGVAVEINPGET